MGQRLLIVDSDHTFLAEQRASLESAFEVEILASPDSENLLARSGSGDIAAALICVEVSENKGYAFCSNLRKLQSQKPALAGMKIALISSKATEEEYKRHQGLKGRADLYLHKPIPPGALVAALSQFVPPRPVDPHNPLGDLADQSDGDFFTDLRNLEVDQFFEMGALSPVATKRLDPKKTAPPRTTQADILQAQIDGLLQELRDKEQEVAAARAEAQADFKSHQDQIFALKAELSGMDATLRSQGRELVQLQESLQHSQAAAREAEARAAGLMETLKMKDAQLETMDREAVSIGAQRDDLQQRLEDCKRSAEVERVELLRGLDRKESELRRLGEQTQQQEREKQNLEAQLAEHGDRLASLHTLLSELSERLRKGVTLAQG